MAWLEQATAIKLVINIGMEEESLQRITQLKEKPAVTLSAEELQQLGLEFFCMSPKEYVSTMEKREIKLENPNDPVEFFVDATLPFYIANKLYGADISVSAIANDLHFSRDELYRIIQFYRIYPIVAT
ncbi:hypothetical protein HZA96_01120 [Candidatus Woesearchaeota archaeon]|nr:hypothetical protein [Candidatus Woesearchaeota archaeon]